MMSRPVKKSSKPKTWFSSLIWTATLGLCLYTLLCYFLSYTLLFHHWVAGFLMLSLPWAQGLCLLSLFYWIFRRAKRSLLPLMTLALGYGFFPRTWGNHSPALDKDPDLSVLNYNVFGMHSNQYESHESEVKALKKFMESHPAEIKCFQEFYFNKKRKAYKGLDYLREANPHYAFLPLKTELYDEGEYQGLAIFSKYPILSKEGKQFENSPNGYLMVDIALPKDTLRIINLQLWSMGIRVGKVAGKLLDQDYEFAQKEGKGILASLKKGFIKHQKEMDIINRLIQDSPHPLLVSGDINEVPYGWAYGTLRERLLNAFEEKGQGFGFTLNRSPYLVRIDQIFHSKELQTLVFKTRRDIPYSDHFPIEARLRLGKNHE